MESINLTWNLKELVNDFLELQNNQNIKLLYQEKILELERLKTEISHIPNVLIVEASASSFIADFLAGIVTEVNLFLGNPYWQNSEWQQVFHVVKPDLIWGETSFRISDRQTKTQLEISEPIIGIPTGGTSGKIKFAVHTLKTLSASVVGFANYFDLNPINSCCILPLYHVSGLMQLFRSLLTKGNFVNFSYTDLKQGVKPKINPQDFFISLVPTQLQFLLETEPLWLSQFHTVLLGGAPAWRSLLQKARTYNIPLSLTYGMTETASGICALLPQDFLQGNISNGKVLPHAQVEIIKAQDNTLPLAELSVKRNKETVGTIKISSESLHLGYYPQLSDDSYLITDDLGFFDSLGYLHLVGRNSHKIITGGENVFPYEVESAILATGLVKDVCVIGIVDKEWGQAVTAIFVPQEANTHPGLIREQMRSRLSAYKHPKYWIPAKSLPRNAQGKIDRLKITNFVENWLMI